MKPISQNAETLKRFLEDRDGYIGCEICGRNGMPTDHQGMRFPNPLELHHIVKRSQGGGDGMLNVILLCRACHNTLHHKGPRGWPGIDHDQVLGVVAGRCLDVGLPDGG